MMQHLPEVELTEYLVGERTPAAASHVASCPVCAAEVARFENAVAGFRGAVHGWSERQMSTPREAGFTRAPRNWRVAQLAAVWTLAALLLFAMAVPVWRSRPTSRIPVVTPAAAELLEQVNAGISRPVPESMEPLLYLMTPEAAAAPARGEERR